MNDVNMEWYYKQKLW